jgi:nitrate reductase NapE component
MRHVHCHSLSNDENTNQNKRISSYLNSLVNFSASAMRFLLHGSCRGSLCGCGGFDPSTEFGVHPQKLVGFTRFADILQFAVDSPLQLRASDRVNSRLNLIRFVNSTHLFESTRPLFQDFFKGRARREAFHFLFFLILVFTVLLHGFLQFGFLVQNGFPSVKSQRQKKNISNQ